MLVLCHVDCVPCWFCAVLILCHVDFVSRSFAPVIGCTYSAQSLLQIIVRISALEEQFYSFFCSWCLTSTETTRLIRDGEMGRGGGRERERNWVEMSSSSKHSDP